MHAPAGAQGCSARLPSLHNRNGRWINFLSNPQVLRKAPEHSVPVNELALTRPCCLPYAKFYNEVAWLHKSHPNIISAQKFHGIRCGQRCKPASTNSSPVTSITTKSSSCASSAIDRPVFETIFLVSGTTRCLPSWEQLQPKDVSSRRSSRINNF